VENNKLVKVFIDADCVDQDDIDCLAAFAWQSQKGSVVRWTYCDKPSVLGNVDESFAHSKYADAILKQIGIANACGYKAYLLVDKHGPMNEAIEERLSRLWTNVYDVMVLDVVDNWGWLETVVRTPDIAWVKGWEQYLRGDITLEQNEFNAVVKEPDVHGTMVELDLNQALADRIAPFIREPESYQYSAVDFALRQTENGWLVFNLGFKPALLEFTADGLVRSKCSSLLNPDVIVRETQETLAEWVKNQIDLPSHTNELEKRRKNVNQIPNKHIVYIRPATFYKDLEYEKTIQQEHALAASPTNIFDSGKEDRKVSHVALGPNLKMRELLGQNGNHKIEFASAIAPSAITIQWVSSNGHERSAPLNLTDWMEVRRGYEVSADISSDVNEWYSAFHPTDYLQIALSGDYMEVN